MRSFLKRHWKSLLAVVCLLIFSCGSYVGYQVYHEHQLKDYYSKFVYYKSPQKIKHYSFLNAKTVAVSWINTDPISEQYISNHSKKYVKKFEEVSSNYLIRDKIRLRGYPSSYRTIEPAFDRNILQKGEYWTIELYKVNQKSINRKPIKINVADVVRKVNKHYVPYMLSITRTNGKAYIRVSYSDTNKRSGAIFIDIATQKVVNSSQLQATSFLDRTAADSFYYLSDLDNYLSNQGINFYDNTISLTKKGIKNSKQWQIAKKYPKVYQILKNGGKLYLMQDGTDMDETAKILQLFTKEGNDIFDGVKIPAEYTTDGQEHTVRSYEEFKKYYKVEG
ncbi:hypothetical protein ACVR0S_07765 [Streptococcus dentapri]|uniref:Lipoprotein n=1 Tax=Streptococcus dentapri TaxID=573564 RepID=A0ABV8D024_9STRE